MNQRISDYVHYKSCHLDCRWLQLGRLDHVLPQEDSVPQVFSLERHQPTSDKASDMSETAISQCRHCSDTCTSLFGRKEVWEVRILLLKANAFAFLGLIYSHHLKCLHSIQCDSFFNVFGDPVHCWRARGRLPNSAVSVTCPLKSKTGSQGAKPRLTSVQMQAAPVPPSS